MTTPPLIIDVFVSTVLAASIIAGMFLIFLARRYNEKEIVSPLHWLAWSIVPSIGSTVFVWVTEKQVAASTYIPWVIAGCVGLNLLIMFWQWRRLVGLRQHPHLAKLIRALPWAIAFGCISFGLQGTDLLFDTSHVILDLLRGAAGLLSIAMLCIGTYRARSQYPGSGFEALGVLTGFIMILVVLSLIATTQERAVKAVVNNQSTLITHLIEKQAEQHLTKNAFDEKSKSGAEELTRFITEITVPELRRTKIIRADGLVLASDLKTLVGTKILLEDGLREAEEGTAANTLITDVDKLPETERVFGSVRIVTVPLQVTAGQPVQGMAQLFFDAPASLASIQSLKDAIAFAGIVCIVMILFFLVFLLRVFRRSISHPFAEILDEMKNIHVTTESGEKRRIKVSGTNDFTTIVTTINQLINEYEEKIRELKKHLQAHGWRE